MQEWILSLIVGIVSLVITAVLFKKYLEKKHDYHLLWSVGMLLWSISAFLQCYAFLYGWNVPTYKLYYFSAVALAGFLGAGTLALVTKMRQVSLGFSAFIVLVTLAFIIAMILTQVNIAALQTSVVGADAIQDSNVRLLAIIINIPAAITFIGGALYSLVKFRKLYALFITLGATIPAIGGTLAAIAIPALLPYTDFIGIIFLGLGFYMSFNITPKKRRTQILE